MNLKRAISGFLLSILFLVIFACLIFFEGEVLDRFFINQNDLDFLSGAISEGAEDVILRKKNEGFCQSNNIEKPEINAKSALSVKSSFSGQDKVILEKNKDVVLPIASLTKLVTAIIVLDNYNPSDLIKISKLADSQKAVKQDIKLGDEISVDVLLQIMMVGSSNKAAYALAEHVSLEKFVDLMNEKVRFLGLKNTTFVEPTGLSPQNVSTAEDLSELAKYIMLNYPEIARISKIKELYVPGVGLITNTNQLLEIFPEIIFGKTGFTEKAGGCLLLITKNLNDKNYLINIILGAEDRFLEMEALIGWAKTVCD